MKTVILFILITGCACICRAQSSVSVTVSNVRNSSGSCNVALYTTAESFLNAGRAFRSKVVKAQKGVVKITFDDVPEGTYAVAAIHDENNDARLNTNFIGIPKEGYGASNNNLPWTSAPTFSKAAFTLSGTGKELLLTLRYY